MLQEQMGGGSLILCNHCGSGIIKITGSDRYVEPFGEYLIIRVFLQCWGCSRLSHIQVYNAKDYAMVEMIEESRNLK